MPYLTSAQAATSSTGVRTGFGIPLHRVVLNVADGPGARPDPHCLEAVGRLCDAGIRVLGHLDAATAPVTPPMSCSATAPIRIPVTPRTPISTDP